MSFTSQWKMDWSSTPAHRICPPFFFLPVKLPVLIRLQLNSLWYLKCHTSNLDLNQTNNISIICVFLAVLSVPFAVATNVQNVEQTKKKTVSETNLIFGRIGKPNKFQICYNNQLEHITPYARMLLSSLAVNRFKFHLILDLLGRFFFCSFTVVTRSFNICTIHSCYLLCQCSWWSLTDYHLRYCVIVHAHTHTHTFKPLKSGWLKSHVWRIGHCWLMRDKHLHFVHFAADNRSYAQTFVFFLLFLLYPRYMHITLSVRWRRPKCILWAFSRLWNDYHFICRCQAANLCRICAPS